MLQTHFSFLKVYYTVHLINQSIHFFMAARTAYETYGSSWARDLSLSCICSKGSIAARATVVRFLTHCITVGTPQIILEYGFICHHQQYSFMDQESISVVNTSLWNNVWSKRYHRGWQQISKSQKTHLPLIHLVSAFSFSDCLLTCHSLFSLLP